MRTLFCNSIYGAGGIGQHFRHLVEESRHEGVLGQYFAYGIRPKDSSGISVEKRTFGLLRYTPLRWSPGWKSHVANELFDRDVATRLPSVQRSIVGGSLMGFAGKSLRTFRKAARLGAGRLELVAPNSHVQNVSRLHARAAADCGLADSWLNQAQIRKTLQEYALADRIYVHSEYVRQSFLDAGIPAAKLVRTVLHPDPRFVPPQRRPEDDAFRIVYVGRVEMTKGIALLLEAFDQLSVSNAELRIVGGWSTRGVRRKLQSRIAQDPRITVQPGDPLPVLQKADVFVHPSYEDGFGYAPMEALACGVPVVVTEDTGMKEYVREGINGFVVPTGSVDAIVAALENLVQSPLARSASMIPEITDPTLATRAVASDQP
jgi:glycosyltransferase involved in cell wall biosynthesis